MKAKRITAFLLVVLMLIIMLPVQVYAEVPTITVTLDPGEGTGTAETFTSTDSGSMAANYPSASYGQFWFEDDRLGFVVPNVPDNFTPPSDNMIFNGWKLHDSDEELTLPDDRMNDITDDLTLTAQWRLPYSTALKSLTPSSGTLDKQFDPGCVSYSIMVPYKGNPVSVTVDAVAQDPDAKVEYSTRNTGQQLSCPEVTPENIPLCIYVTNGLKRYGNYVNQATEMYMVSLCVVYTVTLTTEGQGTAKTYDGDVEMYTAPSEFLQELKATPAPGWKFKEWQIVTGDGSLDYASGRWYYRSGKNNATIKAVFEKLPTYAVTVTNGTDGSDYFEGASVTVTANMPETGKRFKEWTATGITLTDAQKKAASFTFTMPSNAVVLTATYEDIPRTEIVAAPTFSPAGGTYTQAQSVTITCSTTDARIYYTTDGTTPTSGGKEYSGAIDVVSDTTIRAIAVKSGMWDSDVTDATYTINIPEPVKYSVTYRVENGKWNDGSTGNKSETVTDGGTLSDIPPVGNKPNTNYKEGRWSPVTPTANTKITEDTTYTYTYAEKETINHKVTFKVKNGKWDNGLKDDVAVTLTGHEGDALKLSVDQIPTVGKKPDDGFKAGSWDTVPSTEKAITKDATYTYTYIAKDAKTYTVIASDDGHGSAQANPTSGETGRTVTITATPNEGYDFKEWKVISGGITLEDPKKASTTFKIGSANVEVKATFVLKDTPTPTPEKTSIKDATVKLSKSSLKYNGKEQKPVVRSVKLNGKTLSSKTDYDIKWSNSKSKKLGTYTVTITGKGDYKDAKTVNYKIIQGDNPMTVKILKKSLGVPLSKLKKGNQTISRSKYLKVSKNQGKVTYKRTKGDKKIAIDKKTGNITVKKSLKAGTYNVTISVKATGNKNYKAATKKVTVKIVVK